MLGRSRAASALLLGASSLVALEARAEPAPVTHEASPQRNEVVLGTIGIDASVARSSLIALLETELRRAGLSLVQSEPREPLSEWASEATRPARVLATLLLDGRGAEGWRLVVIDAARNRAIARHLPGGFSHDAASVEAVTSIAVSAAVALREGLEIASSPLATVVEDASRPETPPRPHRARPPAPTAAPLRDSMVRPRASLGASVASFSPAAATTQGLSLALGARFGELAEARLLGTLFSPAQLQGPLGDFRLARGWLGAAAGPTFGGGAFSVTPEVGVVAERLRRLQTTPAAGVVATSPAALYRVGGSLSLRLRHTLLRPVSAELVTGAVYFGRRVRFSARSAERAWSIDAWPALAFAQLGLEVAFY